MYVDTWGPVDAADDDNENEVEDAGTAADDAVVVDVCNMADCDEGKKEKEEGGAARCDARRGVGEA